VRKTVVNGVTGLNEGIRGLFDSATPVFDWRD
jgi:hypothetical protein